MQDASTCACAEQGCLSWLERQICVNTGSSFWGTRMMTAALMDVGRLSRVVCAYQNKEQGQ